MAGVGVFLFSGSEFGLVLLKQMDEEDENNKVSIGLLQFTLTIVVYS